MGMGIGAEWGVAEWRRALYGLVAVGEEGEGAAERPKEARSGSSKDFFFVRRDLCGRGEEEWEAGESGEWCLGRDERRGDWTFLAGRPEGRELDDDDDDDDWPIADPVHNRVGHFQSIIVNRFVVVW